MPARTSYSAPRDVLLASALAGLQTHSVRSPRRLHETLNTVSRLPKLFGNCCSG